MVTVGPDYLNRHRLNVLCFKDGERNCDKSSTEKKIRLVIKKYLLAATLHSLFYLAVDVSFRTPRRERRGRLRLEIILQKYPHLLKDSLQELVERVATPLREPDFQVQLRRHCPEYMSLHVIPFQFSA